MTVVSSRTEKYFGWAVLFGVVTTLVALGLYGYLGMFSRYGSDDYCLSAYFLSDVDFIPHLIDRYNNASSRYTNILFIGFVDSVFGWYNVAILPPLMIALFIIGWYLVIREIARMSSLEWGRAFSFVLASLLLFFSLLQAPNLYETLYWRAGMTSHFAPLAFMPFLFLFLFRQINKAADGIPAWWARGACLFLAFMLGGFSEPPIALMVTILVLAIFAFWRRRDMYVRRAALHILPWTLAGALLALVTLAFSPANSIRLGNSAPSLVELISKTFRYPFDFIVYDLRSFPTPTLVSIGLSALLFFIEYSKPSRASGQQKNTRLLFWLVLGTLLAYLLIAASFAPSVYGQNYPIARARFAGRLILTGELMFIGAMLGIWVATLQLKFVRQEAFRLSALIVFLLFTLYPLWTFRRIANDIPEFQQRAQAWDERDAQIRALQAAGERRLIVPFLPNEISQDLGDFIEFRLNRCASVIYEVEWIVALPMEHPE